MNDLAQIEDAAQVVRMAWDQVYDSIPNLIDVLEIHGVGVFRLMSIPIQSLTCWQHPSIECRFLSRVWIWVFFSTSAPGLVGGEVQPQNGRLFHRELRVGTATAPPLFIRSLTA